MIIPRSLFQAAGVVMLVFPLLCSCTDSTPPSKKNELTPVVLMKAEVRTVTITSELSGRISAFKKAEVRPQVGGVLQKRLFEEGACVRKGDALYQIDPARYQAAYMSANAALSKARARIGSLSHRYKRYSGLVGMKAVSHQDLEDVKTEYEQAVAEVAVNEAAVRTARIDLDYTKVYAPIDGRIGRSSCTVGALVTANQTAPLAVIQQTDPVYVDFVQSSMELLSLRERMEKGRMQSAGKEYADIALKLENGAMYPLVGKLRFVDISVDESTGMVSLRAVFPNPEGKLLPGMYARGVLREGLDASAMPVPQRAVIRDPKGRASVFVAAEDQTVSRRFVEVSERVGGCWNVVSGLRAGEMVVVEGFQRLREGMAVKVVQTRNVSDFLKD